MGWQALNIALHRPLDENDRSWTRQHALTSEIFLLSYSLPISTLSLHTTSCARAACHSANATTRVGCAPVHSERNFGLPKTDRHHSNTATIRLL